jgi:hypothetical protein
MILIASLRQQWFRERSSMLRLYLNCLFVFCTPHPRLTAKSETFCYIIATMYVLWINCVNDLRVSELNLDTGIKEISIALSRLLT